MGCVEDIGFEVVACVGCAEGVACVQVVEVVEIVETVKVVEVVLYCFVCCGRCCYIDWIKCEIGCVESVDGDGCVGVEYGVAAVATVLTCAWFDLFNYVKLNKIWFDKVYKLKKKNYIHKIQFHNRFNQQISFSYFVDPNRELVSFIKTL